MNLQPKNGESELDAYKRTFCAKINQDARAFRADDDGLQRVHRDKLEQAEECLEAGDGEMDREKARAKYPALAASIGIEAKTLGDAADVVVAAYEREARNDFEIESIRLAGRRAVRAAETIEQVAAAYRAINWEIKGNE